MDTLVQDLQHAARSLGKSPGFTLVVVLTLALAIGASTAVFSIADALIGHPIRGVSATDRLVVVAVPQKAPAAAADYFDWRRLSGSFESLSAYRQRDANMTGGGVPERVYVAAVLPDFFRTLQAQAGMGRTLDAPDRADRDDTQSAVLSYGLWQRRFGGDAAVVGRVVDIDGRPYTIVGVMSKEFEFPTPTDVWIGLDLTAAERARRDALTLRVIGRLKPSIAIAEAQSEMSTIAQQLERAYPVRNLNRRVRVMPVNEFVQSTITRSAIFMLLAVIGIVLLVACANVAGLQLARAADRQREIVVRAALGATRWRIVRLVLIENAVVSALGAVSGVAVASACVSALLRSMPGSVARLIPGFTHIGIDLRALAFTAVVTMVTCVLAAAAPAFRSAAAAPAESLNEYRITGVAVSRQRLRHAFVAGQLAAAFALLVTSGLFASGFRNLLRSQAIHEPRQVLVMSVALPPARYNDAQARQRFYTEAVDRLAAIPGVQDAATFTTIPLSNNGTSWSLVDVERQIAANPSLRSRVVVQRVSPAFFRLLRLSLVQGRPLERTDDTAHPPVAIVSRSLAGRYWPDGGALGSRIRLGIDDAGAWLTVVGIVDDVMYDWTDRVAEPAVYLPAAQAPAATAQLAIRVNGDVTAFVQPARHELAVIDPLLPAFDVMSLSDAIGESLSGSSQMVAMMQMLTLFTLTIAIVGVYGVMAYLVAARTREFGVRMALGARPRDIARIVLQRSMGLTAVGLACGVLVAVPATRAVRGLVFGVGEDTRVLGVAMAVLLAAVTAIASSVPARRATKSDPLAAIRVE